MRSKVERQSEEAEKAVRDIRCATRRQYSAEEKVRIERGRLLTDVRGCRMRPEGATPPWHR
jgi:hypothetical protein